MVLLAIIAGKFAVSLLAAIFLLLCTDEFYNITVKSGNHKNKILFVVVNLVFYFSLTAFALWNPLPIIVFPSLLVIFIPFILEVLINNNSFEKSTGKIFFAIIYLTVPLALLNFFYLLSGSMDGRLNAGLLGFFLILWINDSFAYITGSLVGRTRLQSRISPGKTWEGTLGGLLFSLCGAWALSEIFPSWSLAVWLGFALITVIFGTFGDLFESVLKRRAGLKESGNLIPGHGGMLDRLDSLLLASPFVFIYLLLVTG